MKQYNKRNHSFEKFTHYKNKSQYFFYNQPLFSASLFNVPIHLRSYICPLLSVLTCIGHAASQTDQSFDGHGLCISQPTLCKFLLLLFNFFGLLLFHLQFYFFFLFWFRCRNWVHRLLVIVAFYLNNNLANWLWLSVVPPWWNHCWLALVPSLIFISL